MRIRSASFIRTIAFLLVIFFTFNTVCQSAPVSIRTLISKKTNILSLPIDQPEFDIKKMRLSSAVKRDSDKTVVLLHDAHCNFDAQKNTSEMITDLVSHHGYEAVYVEGAVGEVNTSFLRSVPDDTAKKEVFAEELRNGSITGVEYAALISPHDFIVHGVDNRTEYYENYKAAMAVMNNNNRALDQLHIISKKTDILKLRLLSNRLRIIDAYINDFFSNKKEETVKSLEDYIKTIFSYVDGYAVLSERFPTVSQFIDCLKKNTEFEKNLMPLLVDELKPCSLAIRDMLISSESERELLAVSKKLELYIKACSLSLTNHEAQLFLKDYIKEDSVKDLIEYMLSNRVDVRDINTQVILQVLESAKSFYKTAVHRDDILFKNLYKNMNENNQKKVVLVVGGFHGSRIEQLLKNSDSSFYSLYPQLKYGNDSVDHYYKLLKNQFQLVTTLQLANYFDLSSNSIRSRDESIAYIKSLIKKIYDASNYTDWNEFAADYKTNLKKALLTKDGINESSPAYISAIRFLDESLCFLENERNLPKQKYTVTNVSDSADNKPVSFFDLINDVLRKSGLNSIVDVNCDAFNKSLKSPNIIQVYEEKKKISIHPLFLDDYSDIASRQIQIKWSNNDGDIIKTELAESIGYHIALSELHVNAGGRFYKEKDGSVSISKDATIYNGAGNTFSLINEACWLWYQYSYRNYRGETWFNDHVYEKVLQDLFEKARPEKYSSEELEKIIKAGELLELIKKTDKETVNVRAAAERLNVTKDELLDLLGKYTYLKHGRQFPLSIQNNEWRRKVIEISLSINEAFFAQSQRGILSIPHYADEIPSDITRDMRNISKRYRSLYFVNGEFIVRSAGNPESEKIVNILNEAVDILSVNSNLDELNLADMSVFVVDNLAENAAKVISPAGRLYLLFDSRFVNAIQKGYEEHKEAVLWVTAERLAHEFAHGNQYAGCKNSEEKHAVEHERILMEVDLPLYKKMKSIEGLSEKIAEYYEQQKPEYRSSYYFNKVLDPMVRDSEKKGFPGDEDQLLDSNKDESESLRAPPVSHVIKKRNPLTSFLSKYLVIILVTLSLSLGSIFISNVHAKQYNDTEIAQLIDDLSSGSSEVREDAAEALGQIGDKRAVEALIIRLGDRDWRVRLASADVLGELGDKRAVAPLIERLNDKTKIVRVASADALGEIGDKRAVEPLIKRLGGSNWRRVRVASADALGKIGDKRAVEALIKRLEIDQWDEEVREASAKALGKIGDKRSVKALIKRLGNRDWRVREASAKALGEIGDKRAVAPLIERLNDKTEIVREASAEALGKIGDKRAVKPLIKRLGDRYWRVREASAEALGKIGDKRAVEPLIKRLAGSNWRVRVASADALGEIGDKRAVEPLIKRLSDGDEDVRVASAKALGKIGDKRAVAPLIERLNDKTEKVRVASADALGEIGDKRAVEPLIKRLGGSNWRVRVASADALGKIGDKRAVECLISRLEAWDTDLREASAKALGKIGDKRAVKPLIERLNDKTKIVREASADALGEIYKSRERVSIYKAICNGDLHDILRYKKASVEPLIQCLSYGFTDDVRLICAEALGQIGDKRAVEPLIERLKNEYWCVQKASAEALGKIGDKRAVEALIGGLRDWNSGVRDASSEALNKMGEGLLKDLSHRSSAKKVVDKFSAADKKNAVLLLKYSARTINPNKYFQTIRALYYVSLPEAVKTVVFSMKMALIFVLILAYNTFLVRKEKLLRDRYFYYDSIDKEILLRVVFLPVVFLTSFVIDVFQFNYASYGVILSLCLLLSYDLFKVFPLRKKVYSPENFKKIICHSGFSEKGEKEFKKFISFMEKWTVDENKYFTEDFLSHLIKGNHAFSSSVFSECVRLVREDKLKAKGFFTAKNFELALENRYKPAVDAYIEIIKLGKLSASEFYTSRNIEYAINREMDSLIAVCRDLALSGEISAKDVFTAENFQVALDWGLFRRSALDAYEVIIKSGKLSASDVYTKKNLRYVIADKKISFIDEFRDFALRGEISAKDVFTAENFKFALAKRCEPALKAYVEIVKSKKLSASEFFTTDNLKYSIYENMDYLIDDYRDLALSGEIFAKDVFTAENFALARDEESERALDAYTEIITSGKLSASDVYTAENLRCAIAGKKRSFIDEFRDFALRGEISAKDVFTAENFQIALDELYRPALDAYAEIIKSGKLSASEFFTTDNLKYAIYENMDYLIDDYRDLALSGEIFAKDVFTAENFALARDEESKRALKAYATIAKSGKLSASDVYTADNLEYAIDAYNNVAYLIDDYRDFALSGEISAKDVFTVENFALARDEESERALKAYVEIVKSGKLSAAEFFTSKNLNYAIYKRMNSFIEDYRDLALSGKISAKDVFTAENFQVALLKRCRSALDAYAEIAKSGKLSASDVYTRENLHEAILGYTYSAIDDYRDLALSGEISAKDVFTAENFKFALARRRDPALKAYVEIVKSKKLSAAEFFTTDNLKYAIYENMDYLIDDYRDFALSGGISAKDVFTVENFALARDEESERALKAYATIAKSGKLSASAVYTADNLEYAIDAYNNVAYLIDDFRDLALSGEISAKDVFTAKNFKFALAKRCEPALKAYVEIVKSKKLSAAEFFTTDNLKYAIYEYMDYLIDDYRDLALSGEISAKDVFTARNFKEALRWIRERALDAYAEIIKSGKLSASDVYTADILNDAIDREKNSLIGDFRDLALSGEISAKDVFNKENFAAAIEMGVENIHALDVFFDLLRSAEIIDGEDLCDAVSYKSVKKQLGSSDARNRMLGLSMLEVFIEFAPQEYATEETHEFLKKYVDDNLDDDDEDADTNAVARKAAELMAVALNARGVSQSIQELYDSEIGDDLFDEDFDDWGDETELVIFGREKDKPEKKGFPGDEDTDYAFTGELQSSGIIASENYGKDLEEADICALDKYADLIASGKLSAADLYNADNFKVAINKFRYKSIDSYLELALSGEISAKDVFTAENFGIAVFLENYQALNKYADLIESGVLSASAVYASSDNLKYVISVNNDSIMDNYLNYALSGEISVKDVFTVDNFKLAMKSSYKKALDAYAEIIKSGRLSASALFTSGNFKDAIRERNSSLIDNYKDLVLNGKVSAKDVFTVGNFKLAMDRLEPVVNAYGKIIRSGKLSASELFTSDNLKIAIAKFKYDFIDEFRDFALSGDISAKDVFSAENFKLAMDVNEGEGECKECKYALDVYAELIKSGMLSASDVYTVDNLEAAIRKSMDSCIDNYLEFALSGDVSASEVFTVDNFELAISMKSLRRGHRAFDAYMNLIRSGKLVASDVYTAANLKFMIDSQLDDFDYSYFLMASNGDISVKDVFTAENFQRVMLYGSHAYRGVYSNLIKSGKLSAADVYTAENLRCAIAGKKISFIDEFRDFALSGEISAKDVFTAENFALARDEDSDRALDAYEVIIKSGKLSASDVYTADNLKYAIDREMNSFIDDFRDLALSGEVSAKDVFNRENFAAAIEMGVENIHALDVFFDLLRNAEIIDGEDLCDAVSYKSVKKQLGSSDARNRMLGLSMLEVFIEFVPQEYATEETHEFLKKYVDDNLDDEDEDADTNAVARKAAELMAVALNARGVSQSIQELYDSEIGDDLFDEDFDDWGDETELVIFGREKDKPEKKGFPGDEGECISEAVFLNTEKHVASLCEVFDNLLKTAGDLSLDEYKKLANFKKSLSQLKIVVNKWRKAQRGTLSPRQQGLYHEISALFAKQNILSSISDVQMMRSCSDLVSLMSRYMSNVDVGVLRAFTSIHTVDTYDLLQWLNKWQDFAHMHYEWSEEAASFKRMLEWGFYQNRELDADALFNTSVRSIVETEERFRDHISFSVRALEYTLIIRHYAGETVGEEILNMLPDICARFEHSERVRIIEAVSNIAASAKERSVSFINLLLDENGPYWAEIKGHPERFEKFGILIGRVGPDAINKLSLVMKVVSEKFDLSADPELEFEVIGRIADLSQVLGDETFVFIDEFVIPLLTDSEEGDVDALMHLMAFAVPFIRIVQFHEDYEALVADNVLGRINNEVYYVSLRDLVYVAKIIRAQSLRGMDINEAIRRAVQRRYYHRATSEVDRELIKKLMIKHNIINESLKVADQLYKFEGLSTGSKEVVIKERNRGHVNQRVSPYELFTVVKRRNPDDAVSSDVVLSDATARNLAVVTDVLNDDEGFPPPVMLYGITAGGKSTLCELASDVFGVDLTRIQINENTDEYDLFGSFQPYEVDVSMSDVCERISSAIDFKEFNNMRNVVLRLKGGSVNGQGGFALNAEELRKIQLQANKEQQDRLRIDFENRKISSMMLKWLGEAEVLKNVDQLNEYKIQRVKFLKSVAFMLDNEVGLRFVEGRFAEAFRNGDIILLDEVNLANEEMLGVLYQVLTQGYLKCGNTTIYPSPGKMPRIVATANPSSYSGRNRLSEAFMNRFEIINIDSMSGMEMSDIVERNLQKQGHSLSDLGLISYLDESDVDDQSIDKRERLVCIRHLAEAQNSLNRALDSGSFVQMSGDRDYRFTLRSIKRIVGDVVERRAAGENVTIDTWVREAYLEFAGVLKRDAIADLSDSSREYRLIRNAITISFDLDPDEFDSIIKQSFSSIDAIYNEKFIELDGLRTYRQNLGESAGSIDRLIPVESTKMIQVQVLKGIRQASPVMLVGQSGGGKSEIIGDLAAQLNYPYLSVSLGDASLESLIGTMEYSRKQGRFVYRPGVLVKAMQDGSILVLEELNMAKSGIVEILNEYFDNGTFTNPYTQKKVRINSNFRLFATMNPVDGVTTRSGGRVRLSPALRNRFREVWVPHEKNDDELKQIIRGVYDRETARLGKSLSTVGMTSKTVDAICMFYRRFKKQFEGSHGEIYYSSLREISRVSKAMAHLMCELGMSEKKALARAVYRTYRRRLSKQEDVDVYASIINSIGIDDVEKDYGDIDFDLTFDRLDVYQAAASTSDKELVASFNLSDIESRVTEFDEKDVIDSRLVESRRTKRNMLNLLEAVYVDSKSALAGRFKPVFLMGGTAGGKSSVVRYVSLHLMKQCFTRIQINESTDEMDLFGSYVPREVVIDYDEAVGIVINAVNEGLWFKIIKALDYLNVCSMSDELDSFDHEGLPADAVNKKNARAQEVLRAILSRGYGGDETARRMIEGIAHILKNGTLNLELTFREGRLLRAMRNGDWVMLDEINLASEESLGVIYQLLTLGYVEYYNRDKGLVERIIPAPGFKLAATANPDYAGRNKLSEAFMNRFEIIFVEGMSTSEIASIVNGEINEKRKDLNSIFYKADNAEVSQTVEKLAEVQSELNKLLEAQKFYGIDSNSRTGYLFTIRNLKKIIRDAEVANFSGNSSPPLVDCILKEAYLEYRGILGRSHENIQLLNDIFVKYFNNLPDLSSLQFSSFDDYISINGLKIEKQIGRKVSSDADVIAPLVELGSTNEIRYQVMKGIKDPNRAIMLVGQSGGGKTEIIGDLARELRWKYRSVSLGNATIDSLVGSYVMDKKKKRFVYEPGILVQAMREGAILVLEEMNMADSGLLEILNEFFDDGMFTNPLTGKKEVIHEDFRLFATMNPEVGVGSRSGGRVGLSPALRSRFSEVWVPHEKSVDEIQKIVRGKFKSAGVFVSVDDADSHIERISKVYIDMVNAYKEGLIGHENNETAYSSLRDISKVVKIIVRSVKGVNLSGKKITDDMFKRFVDHALWRVYRLRFSSSDDIEFVDRTIGVSSTAMVDWDVSDSFASAAIFGVEIGRCEVNELDGIVLTDESRRMIGYILDGFYYANDEDRFNPVMLYGETSGGKSTYAEIAAKMMGKRFTRIQINQRTDEYDLFGSMLPKTAEYDIQSIYHILSENTDREFLLKKVCNKLGIFKDNYSDYMKDVILPAVVKDGLVGEKMINSHEIMVAKKIAVLLDAGYGGIEMTFSEGKFLQAYLRGDVVLLDELNLANEEALSVLYQVLTLGYIEFAGERLFPGEGFQLIATANPSSYAGRNRLSEALMNRFEIYNTRVPLLEEVVTILRKKYQTDLKVDREVIRSLAEMQMSIDEHSREGDFDVFNHNGAYRFSLRNLERIIKDAISRSETSPDISLKQILLEEAYAEYVSLAGQTDENIKTVESLFNSYFGDSLKFDDFLCEWRMNSTDQFVSINGVKVHKRKRDTDALRTHKLVDFKVMALVRTQILKGFRDGEFIDGKHISNPVLLVGQSGAGKTDMIADVARELGWQYDSISLGTATVETLVGTFALNEDTGTFDFNKGVLIRAMEQGHVLVLEEINMSESGVLEILNEYFDTGAFVIPDTGRKVVIHPDFRLFGTMNPLDGVLGKNNGRVGLSPALRSRFREVWVRHEKTTEEKARILVHLLGDVRSGISEDILGVKSNVHYFQPVDKGVAGGEFVKKQAALSVVEAKAMTADIKECNVSKKNDDAKDGVIDNFKNCSQKQTDKSSGWWKAPPVRTRWNVLSEDERLVEYKDVFQLVSRGKVALEAGANWAYAPSINTLYYPKNLVMESGLDDLIGTGIHESMHRYGTRYLSLFKEYFEEEGSLPSEIFNVLEDARIENWARLRFKGAASYLVKMNKYSVFGNYMMQAWGKYKGDRELLESMAGRSRGNLKIVRDFLHYMGKRGFIPGNEKHVAYFMSLVKARNAELYDDLYSLLIGKYKYDELKKANALPSIADLLKKREYKELLSNGMLGMGTLDDVVRVGNRGVFSLIPIRLNADGKPVFYDNPTKEIIDELAMEQGERIREEIMPIVYKWAVRNDENNNEDDGGAGDGNGNQSGDNQSTEGQSGGGQSGEDQSGDSSGNDRPQSDTSDASDGNDDGDHQSGGNDDEKRDNQDGQSQGEATDKDDESPENEGANTPKGADGDSSDNAESDASAREGDEPSENKGSQEDGAKNSDSKNDDSNEGDNIPSDNRRFKKDWESLPAEERDRILSDIRDILSDKVKDKSRLSSNDYLKAKDESLLYGEKTERERILSEIGGMVTELMGYLNEIITNSVRPKEYLTRRGGVIDSRRLMKSIGSAFSDGMKFYKKKTIPTKKNVSFTLLVDESGSMKGVRGYNAVKGAVLFSEVLEALDMDFQIMGYGSSSHVHKQFRSQSDFKSVPNQYSTVADKDRIVNSLYSNIGAHGANNERDALVSVVEDIKKYGQEEHYVILLTDGGTDESQVRPVLDEIELNSGMVGNSLTEIIALGIGDETKDVLDIYGNRSLYIKDHELREIPRRVRDLLGAIIKGAFTEDSDGDYAVSSMLKDFGNIGNVSISEEEYLEIDRQLAACSGKVKEVIFNGKNKDGSDKAYHMSVSRLGHSEIDDLMPSFLQAADFIRAAFENVEKGLDVNEGKDVISLIKDKFFRSCNVFSSIETDNSNVYDDLLLAMSTGNNIVIPEDIINRKDDLLAGFLFHELMESFGYEHDSIRTLQKKIFPVLDYQMSVYIEMQKQLREEDAEMQEESVAERKVLNSCLMNAYDLPSGNVNERTIILWKDRVDDAYLEYVSREYGDACRIIVYTEANTCIDYNGSNIQIESSQSMLDRGAVDGFVDVIKSAEGSYKSMRVIAPEPILKKVVDSFDPAARPLLFIPLNRMGEYDVSVELSLLHLVSLADESIDVLNGRLVKEKYYESGVVAFCLNYAGYEKTDLVSFVGAFVENLFRNEYLRKQFMKSA